MARLTRHGERRVRGRMGLPKRATAEMADRALAQGLHRESTTGRLRRYLDALHSREGADPVVYAGVVFIFDTGALVTCWPLPGNLRKLAP